MRIGNVAIPVLIFIVTLIQAACLVSKTIDTVVFIKCFDTLYGVIRAVCKIEVVPILLNQLDKGIQYGKKR